MVNKRKLEEQSRESSEPSQKQKQKLTAAEELEIENQVYQSGSDDEIEYEEVEVEVEDDEYEEEEDDGDEDEDESRNQTAETSGFEINDELIEDLLEPFSKDQLSNLLKEAAEKHIDVANRIREVANEDPVHRKIFVHGLGWDTKTETLIESFKKFGEIEDSKVVFDKVTGKSKGYGFILFKSRSSAKNALKQPQKKIGHRMAACQLASKGPVFGLSGPASAMPAHNSNTEQTQRKIYVSNVGAELDPQKLLSFFSKFGEIEEGPLGLDKFTGRPKGFCLFVYKSSESAKRALEEPHKTFEGHVLYCQRAIDGPKPSKQQQNNPFYGHGHLMAGNQAAIGQALTALLVSQGAGLAFNPAIGQALLGYDTQGMAPGYSTQAGYQTPKAGKGGKGRGKHGTGQYTPYMGK